MKKDLNINEIRDMNNKIKCISILKKISKSKEYSDFINLKLHWGEAFQILGEFPIVFENIIDTYVDKYVEKYSLKEKYINKEMELNYAVNFRNCIVNDLREYVCKYIPYIDKTLIEFFVCNGLITTLQQEEILRYGVSDYKTNSDIEMEEYNASYECNYKDSKSCADFISEFIKDIKGYNVTSAWYSYFFSIENNEISSEYKEVFQKYIEETSEYEDSCMDIFNDDMYIICIEGILSEELAQYFCYISDLDSCIYIENEKTYIQITSNQLENGLDLGFFIDLIINE